MRCPACGGTNLRPIAPGFWQCESTVADEHIVMGPTPGAPPHLGMTSPQVMPQSRICGHRWQVGGAPTGGGLPCACGVFAIGQCLKCGAPLCGQHAFMVDGSAYCHDHAQEARAEHKRQVVEAVCATVEESWRHRLGALVEGLGTVVDGEARAFCAWVLRPRLFADPPRLQGRPTQELEKLPAALRREAVNRYRSEIEARFSELFADAHAIRPFSGYARDPAEWRFEPQDVLGWLESRARPDVRLTVWSQRKGAIFSKKVTDGVYGGWKVHEGVVHSGQDYSSRMWRYVDYALTTGKVVRADTEHGGRWRSDGYQRDLEQDDWDKLLDRLRVSVPGAPLAALVQRATSESSD